MWQERLHAVCFIVIAIVKLSSPRFLDFYIFQKGFTKIKKTKNKKQKTKNKNTFPK